jgi:predicted TIM-barrel fold metal-dependent hydrolase
METIYIDGDSFTRKLPTPAQAEFLREAMRPLGARNVKARLADLDKEGIWGELVYPSLGMWNASFNDPALLREAIKVSNDWALEELESASTRRLVAALSVSVLSIEDAVAELVRVAERGARAVFLPTAPPAGSPDYNRDDWEPFWSAAEQAGIVLCIHVGSDPVDMRGGHDLGVVVRGPGGSVVNYLEASLGGQRAVAKLVASGALDRHPELKVLVSEGGASWVPFLGDRMNESYRQQGTRARPKLSCLPKEILYRQVYASFQHDESAVTTVSAHDYTNVLWGSDYPHQEGTFGHTQETLHGLFAGVSDDVRERVTIGAFLDLFPDVGRPPQAPLPMAITA